MRSQHEPTSTVAPTGDPVVTSDTELMSVSVFTFETGQQETFGLFPWSQLFVPQCCSGERKSSRPVSALAQDGCSSSVVHGIVPAGEVSL